MLWTLFTFFALTSAHASPACCSGVGDQSLQTMFIELLKKDFLVPQRPVGKPTAYVITADGERLWLDSPAWDAARRLAATFTPPPDAPVADAETFSWGPWIRALVPRARSLSLEISATFMDMFFRFGPTSALLMLGAETIEHYVIPIPICKAVQSACVLVSRDVQDLTRALVQPFPGVNSPWERVRLLRLSWKLRRQRKQALRQVFHADGRTVESPEPQTAGAEVLSRSCFKSALGTPDFDGIACAEDHAAGLRYGGFGRAKAGPARPRAEDLGPPELNAIFKEDPVERAWTASDLVDLLTIKLNMAEAQARLVRDRKGSVGAFFRLRRRLTGMRRALDYYAYTVSIRAGLARPRTDDEAEVDRRFAATLKEFLIEFDRSVQMALIGLGREPHPFATFKTLPKQAFSIVKEWSKRAPVAAVGCEAEFSR